MNNAQIITVNKQRFVAGLYWQSLTRPRAYLQEAKEIGKRERMDVVAIRRGRVLQAGFASRATAGSNAYSFAAALAGMLGDDWIGVFELDQGTYAIAAVKNGAIIPGCDDVGPRSQIEESLRTNFNLHQFSRVICPTDFDFGGEEMDLSKVLSSGRLLKDYRLKPLGGGGSGGLIKALVIGFLVLLLFGMAGGGYFYYKMLEQQKADAAAAVAAAAEQKRLEELKAATGQEVTPVALTHPWATQPFMRELREACVDGIRRLPLSLGGWLIESATCSNGMTQAVYKRQPTTTVNGWTLSVQTSGYRLDSIDGAGDTGILSIPLAEVKPAGDDALLDIGLVTDAVRSLLQSREASFTITPKNVTPPAPPVLPGKEAPPPPPVPDWKTQSFSISGRNSPRELLAGMEDLPAIRLLTVSAKRADTELTWSLTGEINGK